jgi:hypothetical protein
MLFRRAEKTVGTFSSRPQSEENTNVWLAKSIERERGLILKGMLELNPFADKKGIPITPSHRPRSGRDWRRTTT